MKRKNDDAHLQEEEERLLALSPEDPEWDRQDELLDRLQERREALRRVSNFSDPFSKEAIAKAFAEHRTNKRGHGTHAEVADEPQIIRTERKSDTWMSTMFPDGHSPYGRVKLPLLAPWSGLEREALLRTVEDFCMMRFSRAIYRRHRDFKVSHEEDRDGLRRNKVVKRSADDPPPSFRFELPEVLPRGFDKENPEHRCIGKAMTHFGRRGGDIERFYDVYDEAMQFLEENDLEEDQPCFDVPLKLLRAEQNRDLRAPDYLVLFAVNSCLGEKGYRRITKKMIAARTAGVKNSNTAPHWMGEPLTERQVQYSLGKLQARGFFHRVLVGSKSTFIANPKRLDLDELVALAKNWKRKKAAGRATRV